MIIRNDDVAFDTDVSLLRQFCELCDRYGHQIIQGITPIGSVKQISVYWDDAKIKDSSGIDYAWENTTLWSFLKSRKNKDLFAVHGLWHTHSPHSMDIKLAKKLLSNTFRIDYFIPPFNEGNYGEYIHGLKVLDKNCDRLETFHDNGTMPKTDIAYLHSWRYANAPYNLKQLEHFFKVLQNERI